MVWLVSARLDRRGLWVLDGSGRVEDFLILLATGKFLPFALDFGLGSDQVVDPYTQLVVLMGVTVLTTYHENERKARA